MILVPNSFGVDTPLTEYNTCHTPGGTPKGGQFGSKGTCGDTASGGVASPPPAPAAAPRMGRIIAMSNSADDDVVSDVLGRRVDVEEMAKAIVKYTDKNWNVEIETEGGLSRDAAQEQYR